jgi:glutaconate CoA-transferase subunit A
MAGRNGPVRSLPEVASLVEDGDTVALGGALSWREPMALVRELIRQGRTGLRLVGSAHGIDADLLVAAGAVAVAELSYVGFEHDFGLAPAYRRACERGELEVRETCCYTLLQQLRAAEQGAPYAVLRSVVGTDILGLHPEYGTAKDADGRPLVLVPALAPDVALIHGTLADRHGNVHLEIPYVLDERYARAARKVLVTVERVVGDDELRRAGVTIPAPFVTAVAEVPFGAHPTSCYPDYTYDRDHLAAYVAAASAGEAALTDYVERLVRSVDEEGYRQQVGQERLEQLRSWSESLERWQALARGDLPAEGGR